MCKLTSKSSVGRLLGCMIRFHGGINRNLTARQVPAAIKLSLFACEGCKVSSRDQLLTNSKAEAEVKVYPGAAYFLPVFFPPPALPRARKVDVGWETCIIQCRIIRPLHSAETSPCCLLPLSLSTVALTQWPCNSSPAYKLAAFLSLNLCPGCCGLPTQSVCFWPWRGSSKLCECFASGVTRDSFQSRKRCMLCF